MCCSTLACAVTGFTRHKVKFATNTVLPAEHLLLVWHRSIFFVPSYMWPCRFLFFSRWGLLVFYYCSNLIPSYLTTITVKPLEGGDSVCKHNDLNFYPFFFCICGFDECEVSKEWSKQDAAVTVGKNKGVNEGQVFSWDHISGHIWWLLVYTNFRFSLEILISSFIWFIDDSLLFIADSGNVNVNF